MTHRKNSKKTRKSRAEKGGRRRKIHKSRSKKGNLLSKNKFWKLFGHLSRKIRRPLRKLIKSHKMRKKTRRRRQKHQKTKKHRRRRKKGGNDDDDTDDEEHSHPNDECWACENGLEHGHTYGPKCDFVSPGMTKAEADKMDIWWAKEQEKDGKNPQED